MKKKALIFGGIVLVIGIAAVTCAVLFLDKDKDNSKALEFKEEYEKVNSRYEFLTNQKEDLLHAEETLLNIMNSSKAFLLKWEENAITLLM